jgi:hypothetical protein
VAAVALAGCSSSGGGSTKGSPSGTSSPRASSTAATGDLSSLSATALLAKASTAMSGAPIHVKGSATANGQPIQIDLQFKGTDAWGSLDTGGKVQIESIGGSDYLKAEDAFWKNALGAQADAAIARINGRWLKFDPTDVTFGTLATLAEKKTFVSNLLSPSGTVTKGGTSTVNGVDVIALVDSGTDGGTLYLDKSTGRPVQIVPPASSADTGSINFTYEDPGAAPQPPAASDVINAGALLAGSSGSSSKSPSS